MKTRLVAIAHGRGTPLEWMGAQLAQGSHPDSLRRRVATGLAIGAGAVTIAAVTAGAVLSVVAARMVVMPPKRREEDVRILGHDTATITLSATIDSLTPGRYSLWFLHDTGHARVGEILEHDDETVTRELLAIDYGDLSLARRGRLAGWFYLSPEELGYPYRDVEIDTELGPAPAWLIPAAEPGDRWVIQVHGRAVRRQEALRAVPVFRDAGFTSLLVSYRNDGDAPPSRDGRYALGDSEWRDVDAAMRFALDHGARELVLMGWSMGGATVLQALTRSERSDAVIGVVLDSPVVDWVTALHFQAALNRLPWIVGAGALALLTSAWARPLTGSAQPIDFARMDLVARARELDRPLLLLHSDDDGYVPVTASQALAVARPDIVQFEEFTTARHTKLWNYDPARWNGVIERWLRRLTR